MAGDWIKMRPSLLTNPKVNGIARYLEGSAEVGRVLTTGFSGSMAEVVTRNVMRNVTVSCLLTVWGAANEHTTDGVFSNADLSDIDDMVGIPGFGAAMESVGWLIHDADACTVTLPNFSEYNTCGKDRAAEKNAERQRRFRERKASAGNVTHNVTSNDREEKRREEIYTTSAGPRDRFAMFESWRPDEVSLTPQLRMSGVSPDAVTPEAIAEFVGYWLTHTDHVETQAAWCRKLVLSIRTAATRLAGAPHDTAKTGGRGAARSISLDRILGDEFLGDDAQPIGDGPWPVQ
jgi:hypothetical protein